MILASDCKCCICEAQAVCFWPVIDPDIPSHPYCREHGDEAKMRVMAKVFNDLNEDEIKAIVKAPKLKYQKADGSYDGSGFSKTQLDELYD